MSTWAKVVLILALQFFAGSAKAELVGAGATERRWNLERESWGYLDERGKVVVEPQFVRAGPFQHGYAECYGYVDSTGKPDWKTPIFIDRAGDRLLGSTDKYGYPPSKTSIHDHLTVGKREIVRDNYVSILGRRGRYQLVRRPYEYCVCNLDGDVLKVIPWNWQPMGINPRTENFWFKYGEQAFDFTGKESKEIPGFEAVKRPPDFDKQYKYCAGFSEGLAAVMIEQGHWAYIDANGRMQIDLPEHCSNAQSFSEGLAAVALGGKPWHGRGHAGISPFNGARFGFIDHTGHFLIPPKFPSPVDNWQTHFTNGLAVATDTKNGDTAFGFINRDGAFVIPPVYASVHEFRDGLAAVNAGPVGFDRLKWLNTQFGFLGGGGRADQCMKFLRQYDLVGMPVAQVRDLLGKPDSTVSRKDLDLYTIWRSCTGGESLALRHTGTRVAAYSIMNLNTRQYRWITTNVKPEIDQNLNEFCQQFGIVDGTE